MAKLKSERGEINVRQNTEPAYAVKVGKIEYFEKFRGIGRILQSDVTTIPFLSWRTTYPVKEGDVVNYRLEMGPLGLHAVDIAKMP
ncbi:MAG TPA: hypothetical protein VHE54_17945 [Puia sp.]|nr:hypothetical protein [Puia sp.]